MYVAGDQSVALCFGRVTNVQAVSSKIHTFAYACALRTGLL